MVKYNVAANSGLDAIFLSLADPTRRHILRRVSRRPLTVSEVAKPYDMSLPAISKHLKVLEKARLIIRKRHGREHLIQLNPGALRTARQHIIWYEKFWDEKLSNLQRHLEGGDQT